MLSAIFSVLILVADVWAILNVAQSTESNGTKAVWIVAIVLLPLVGFIAWYFAGPKSASG
jgi:Mg2+ and Co2+ transporter CorA